VTLFIEQLDDFHFEAHENALDIVQVKHHIGGGGDLTDTSADLWRTINAWITILDLLEVDEIASFFLLTTSTAAPGSIAAVLREDNDRLPELALERLLTTAKADGADTTRPWRERFAALPPDRQTALVSAITVADQQPQLADIDAELNKEFAPMVRQEHLDAFIERLKGWWIGRVARLLTGQLRAVAVEDLWHFIQELRDGFSLDNLPFEYEVPDPTDEEHKNYAASTFTNQLRIVNVAHERIALAIRDYHRAYTNTSRWSREGLLLPGEIGKYEMRIVDEWQRHFERMRQEVGNEATEAAMCEAGRSLWSSLDSDIPMPLLRPRLEEPVISRGTLHSLADVERVGWHPEFRERLRELLTEMTA
jgi:hypothetical protein